MASGIKQTLSGSAMNRRENQMRPTSPGTLTPKTKRLVKAKPFIAPKNAKGTVRDPGFGGPKRKKPSYYTPSSKSSDYQLGDPNGVRSARLD